MENIIRKNIIITFIILTFFTLIGHGNVIDESDLNYRNDKYYEVNSDTPYTGKIVSYYENGQLEYLENYKDGVAHGLCEGYYENGQLSYSENYKNDYPHGLCKGYYENGQLEYSENYKDGELHGLLEHYYENGQMERYGNFVNGEPDGFTFTYYENGQLEYLETYEDGELHGLQECYDEDGQLIYSEVYSHGELESDDAFEYLYGNDQSDNSPESTMASIIESQDVGVFYDSLSYETASLLDEMLLIIAEWDETGAYQGLDEPKEIFVKFAELEDDSGFDEIFDLNGTITSEINESDEATLFLDGEEFEDMTMVKENNEWKIKIELE